MFTERIALQEELHDIRMQMMELREQKMSVMKRLREIDERDMKSNSIDVMENLSSKLIDALGIIAEIVPNVSAPEMIEYLQEKKQINPELVEDPNEKAAEPTQVEEAAQKEKIHKKPQQRFSKEHNASLIKTILEETGREMKLNEIQNEFFARCGVRYRNFGEQMTRAKEQFPKIKSTTRGYYKLEAPSLIEYSEQLQDSIQLN